MPISILVSPPLSIPMPAFPSVPLPIPFAFLLPPTLRMPFPPLPFPSSPSLLFPHLPCPSSPSSSPFLSPNLIRFLFALTSSSLLYQCTKITQICQGDGLWRRNGKSLVHW